MVRVESEPFFEGKGRIPKQELSIFSGREILLVIFPLSVSMPPVLLNAAAAMEVSTKLLVRDFHV